MLFSVAQAFVGRNGKRAPPKTPSSEANLLQEDLRQRLSNLFDVWVFLRQFSHCTRAHVNVGLLSVFSAMEHVLQLNLGQFSIMLIT